MLQKTSTAPVGSPSLRDMRCACWMAKKARNMKVEPSTRMRWSPALIGGAAAGAGELSGIATEGIGATCRPPGEGLQARERLPAV